MQSWLYFISSPCNAAAGHLQDFWKLPWLSEPFYFPKSVKFCAVHTDFYINFLAISISAKTAT